MITIVHLITGLETAGAERMLFRLVARTDRDRFRSVVVSITGAGSVGPAFREAGVELMTLGVRRGLPGSPGSARASASSTRTGRCRSRS